MDITSFNKMREMQYINKMHIAMTNGIIVNSNMNSIFAGPSNKPSSPRPSISSSVNTFQPPEFDFSLYMLSFPKHYDLEKQIAAIDLAFAKTHPYQYQLREKIRTEKALLLEQLKGKQKVSETPREELPHKVVSFHEPATIYKAYPDKHESKQQYRLSTRETLRAMVKEKQQQIKQLCTEVSELWDHIKILDAEEEHSSEEEVNKFIKGDLDRDVEIVDTTEDLDHTVNTHPGMFLMSSPKLYIQIKFDLKEFKPYTLSCQIDSGF